MKEIGLWIDYRKAIIVIIKDEDDVTLEIKIERRETYPVFQQYKCENSKKRTRSYR